MSKRFEFEVVGNLPPKKDGANSMWRKSSERERLIALRKAAIEVVRDGEPLSQEITLILDIYCNQDTYAAIGDLDNFITGVCDGLMKAHRHTPTDGWDEPNLAAIHPKITIAIEDDREIVEIRARKIRTPNDMQKYHVILQGK